LRKMFARSATLIAKKGMILPSHGHLKMAFRFKERTVTWLLLGSDFQVDFFLDVLSIPNSARIQAKTGIKIKMSWNVFGHVLQTLQALQANWSGMRMLFENPQAVPEIKLTQDKLEDSSKKLEQLERVGNLQDNLMDPQQLEGLLKALRDMGSFNAPKSSSGSEGPSK